MLSAVARAASAAAPLARGRFAHAAGCQGGVRAALLSYSADNLGTVVVGSVEDDFPDRYDLGRLNNGSFGGTPVPVKSYQAKWKAAWDAYPDSYYFSGHLHADVTDAADACADLLGTPREESMLVENASVGAVIVAQRWMWKFVEQEVRPGDGILMFNFGYLACRKIVEACVNHYCVRAGARLVFAELPFPFDTDDAGVLAAVDKAVRGFNAEHAAAGNRVRFALLDHITSQPAIRLPVKEATALCRSLGVEEVAIDGAHSVGTIGGLDIPDLDGDFFFSNLHKWGLSPHCCTFMHAKAERIVGKETSHPVISWDWGNGLKKETSFTGTREYSSLVAAPAAVKYLRDWRSESGETVEEHNAAGIRKAAALLREGWETEPAQTDASVGSQEMVRLPEGLEVPDVPGTPDAPVRTLLRDKYGVEAALGAFPGGRGNFVRLSYAAYNTLEDVEKLRDAVLEIRDDQRAGRL